MAISPAAFTYSGRISSTVDKDNALMLLVARGEPPSLIRVSENAWVHICRVQNNEIPAAPLKCSVGFTESCLVTGGDGHILVLGRISA